MNSSLRQCIPIASLSPSCFTMSWFCLLWAAEQRTEKDLSCNQTDSPAASVFC